MNQQKTSAGKKIVRVGNGRVERLLPVLKSHTSDGIKCRGRGSLWVGQSAMALRYVAGVVDTGGEG